MNITICISSGIAAYKIPDLIKILKAKGHDITVIMTESATKMIAIKEVEKASGNKVFSKLFEKNFNYKKILESRKVDHIEVAKKTDLFIIAPATANTVAKLAQGITDDFLTTTILATLSPVLVCPSMNTNMWFHPATKKNIATLISYGYYVMDPESGDLACGTEGLGRLPKVENIAKEAENILKISKRLKGKKIIVTSGGTIEPIDSARVLTNRSTGKMGVALAEECYRHGARVLLVRSESSIGTHLPIKQMTFQTAKDLETILQNEVPSHNTILHAAAVSDFTTKKIEDKLDSVKPISLTLQPTRKIINEIKKWNSKIKLIGFKAVHGIDKDKIKTVVGKKFKDTDVDYLIVNDISRNDVGFATEDNEVYIFSKKGMIKKIDKTSKKEIAKKIIELILNAK